MVVMEVEYPQEVFVKDTQLLDVGSLKEMAAVLDQQSCHTILQVHRIVLSNETHKYINVYYTDLQTYLLVHNQRKLGDARAL